MTKIDIFSGFLGAGKTTLIKKLLKEAMDASKVVLIENEFGEIGIDGGFLKEAGVEIKEMNSGCICCSLVGDFGTSLAEVLDKYHPERILIEPSGVGKLSDVMKAVQNVKSDVDVQLNSAVVVVDANKCKMYAKNFGEFFLNQIEHAGTIILSRTADISESKLNAALEIIREHNSKATVITTPWDELDGKKILETIENAKDLEAELMEEVAKLMMNMSIIMTMVRTAHVAAMITTMMRTSMSIIITTTMMRTSMNIITMTMMSIITIMKRNIITGIIMTMTTMMRTAHVAAMTTTMSIITITMQMRYSQAGVWRHPQPIPRMRSRQSLKSWMMQTLTA